MTAPGSSRAIDNGRPGVLPRSARVGTNPPLSAGGLTHAAYVPDHIDRVGAGGRDVVADPGPGAAAGAAAVLEAGPAGRAGELSAGPRRPAAGAQGAR